jgi:uncharacterized protein with NRDE domain
MCLLVLAWRAHPGYRLIVAANRDEYHERPAAPLARWNDPPAMYAGRDLRAGGTWLGADAAGRVGIVTNFREVQRTRRTAPSRGGLIPAFFATRESPGSWLATLEVDAPAYSGFNLLLADGDSLWYASNRADAFARELDSGVYGLSNHFLDTPWPKLERVRSAFRAALAAREIPEVSLLSLLADREPAGLPEGTDVGLSPDLARAISAPFVSHPVYGTRCSTVVLVPETGSPRVRERRFDPHGELAGETEFELNG